MQVRLTLNPHTRDTISLKEVVVMSFISMGSTTTVVMVTNIMATPTMVDTRVTMEVSEETIITDINIPMDNIVPTLKGREISPM